MGVYWPDAAIRALGKDRDGGEGRRMHSHGGGEGVSEGSIFWATDYT